MKRKVITTARQRRSFLNRTLLLVAAFCVVGSACSRLPASGAESGIRGTVLWGPVAPGPERLGQSDEAPLKATFIVFRDGQMTTTFDSDDDGLFEVSLPAGDYLIVPDKSTPIPYPLRQTTEVSVPADSVVVVTIRLDTGMK